MDDTSVGSTSSSGAEDRVRDGDGAGRVSAGWTVRLLGSAGAVSRVSEPARCLARNACRSACHQFECAIPSGASRPNTINTCVSQTTTRCERVRQLQTAEAIGGVAISHSDEWGGAAYRVTKHDVLGSQAVGDWFVLAHQQLQNIDIHKPVRLHRRHQITHLWRAPIARQTATLRGRLNLFVHSHIPPRHDCVNVPDWSSGRHTRNARPASARGARAPGTAQVRARPAPPHRSRSHQTLRSQCCAAAASHRAVGTASATDSSPPCVCDPRAPSTSLTS